MVVVESAILLGVGYKFYKHRKNKKAAVVAATPVYGLTRESSQPPTYSQAVIPSTAPQTSPLNQPSAQEQRVDASPDVPIGQQPSSIGSETEWRPVYMLERSTSKTAFNDVRTHRALFVGDFEGARGTGKAHEIRKHKSSVLGVDLPFNRTMKYTDAEQWVGDKALDRKPVFLGHTNWTDEQLNSEGKCNTQT